MKPYRTLRITQADVRHRFDDDVCAEDPITVQEFGSEFDAVMRLRDALKQPHIK